MFLVALSIGIIMAIQSAINAQLRSYVGSPYLTSWISFTVALPFLAVMTYVTGASLGFSTAIFHREPLYIRLGGLCGAIALTSNIVLFAILGSVQTAILPVLGMTFASMVIDHFTWFQAPHYAFGWHRLVGTLCVLMGVVLVVYQPKKLNLTTKQWPWRLLGIGAGTLLAIQVAVNGRLSTVLHSAPHAALVSFAVGMMTLACVVIVTRQSFAQINIPFRKRAPLWIWLGGILGGTFVLTNAYLANKIGTAQTVVFALFGQMTASVIIQQFGCFRSEQQSVRALQILGIVCIMIGVVVIRLW